MAHQEQHDGGTDSRLGTAWSTFTAIYNGTLKYLSKEQLMILGLACFAVWP